MNDVAHPPARFPENYREAVVFMFSHAGPWALLSAFLLCLAVRFMLGHPSSADACVLVVFVGLRGFMEWGLHRYVFNAAPLPLLGLRLKNPISTLHGIHHENPRQVEALFFGWKGVVAVLVASFLVLLPGFRDVGLAVTGILAVSVNLLLYEWFHMVAHSPIEPVFPPFRAAVSNHRYHHFVDGKSSLGVTSVLADKIFGTYRNP